MLLTNPLASGQNQPVVCRSYCVHCRATTAWRTRTTSVIQHLTRIGVDSSVQIHQLTCTGCYSPVVLDQQEFNEIQRLANSQADFERAPLYQALTQRVTERQHACLVSSQANWLSHDH